MRYWPIVVIVAMLFAVGAAVYLYQRDGDETRDCRPVPQSSPLSVPDCSSATTIR